MKTTNPFIASVADQSGEMVELIPQDSQTLTADDPVTWSDVAALAEYYYATRSPDWELDKYQDASDRINKALRTADLRAALNQGQG